VFLPAYTITMKYAFIALVALFAVANAVRVEPEAPQLLLSQPVISPFSDVALREEFAQWMTKFEKAYESEQEKESKFSVFSDNKQFVEEHNGKGKSFWLELNHLADLTVEEFKGHYNGYKANGLDAKAPVDEATWEYNNVEAADSVDWRTKGAVTPVKNQGQCGSCWAFSTTGSIEGVNAIKTGKLVSVSEQELVDCSKNGNMGCNGGLMDYAFKWVIDNGGLDTESDYTYKAADAQCDAEKEKKDAASITGFQDVPKNSEDALAKAVTMQPVSIAIEADQRSFQLYGGGVYDATDCGTQLDHGVLVIGYGKVTKEEEEKNPSSHKHFWIVKNSWGETWGEQGFIRLAKGGHGSAGQCGLCMSASYPTKK